MSRHIKTIEPNKKYRYFRKIYRLVCSKSHHHILNSLRFGRMFALLTLTNRLNENRARALADILKYSESVTFLQLECFKCVNRRTFQRLIIQQFTAHKNFEMFQSMNRFAIDSHKIHQLHNFSQRNKFRKRDKP